MTASKRMSVISSIPGVSHGKLRGGTGIAPTAENSQVISGGCDNETLVYGCKIL